MSSSAQRAEGKARSSHPTTLMLQCACMGGPQASCTPPWVPCSAWGLGRSSRCAVSECRGVLRGSMHCTAGLRPGASLRELGPYGRGLRRLLSRSFHLVRSPPSPHIGRWRCIRPTVSQMACLSWPSLNLLTCWSASSRACGHAHSPIHTRHPPPPPPALRGKRKGGAFPCSFSYSVYSHRTAGNFMFNFAACYSCHSREKIRRYGVYTNLSQRPRRQRLLVVFFKALNK
jgi:hypothetical protein